MREDDWQRQVIDTAHMFGWLCAHFRPLMTKHGWRTPVQADGKGWPDLLLCRDTIIAAELKTDTGSLTPDQVAWLERLRFAGVETHVWRPRDAEEVMKRLARRRPTSDARPVWLTREQRDRLDQRLRLVGRGCSTETDVLETIIDAWDA